MSSSQDFAYTLLRNPVGETALRPLLTVDLSYKGRTVNAVGLVDSGSDINVLPYEIGSALGLRWENQSHSIKLSGNMSRVETRIVGVSMRLGNFPSVDIAFAWTNIGGAPFIFGQVNFFDVYDVCFHRTKSYFSITLL